MTGKNPEVYCFGEVLWDCLPAGLFLGGAPVNVAYHLQQQGVQAVPVTAVGDDFLGKEIQRRFHLWGLSADAVRVEPDWPTGVVTAELDASGNATYEIVENVAWDHIEVTDEVVSSVGQADALIFGSLSQRSATNRESLKKLIEAGAAALKVFDVNFRPPFDDHDRTRELAGACDLIKLNHDEIAALVGGEPGHYEANAREWAGQCGKGRICVTAGEAGAGLLEDGTWVWEPGRSIDVADTVGTGDSFLATLVRGLLTQKPVEDVLRESCRTAEWVATRRGAQPDYTMLNNED